MENDDDFEPEEEEPVYTFENFIQEPGTEEAYKAFLNVGIIEGCVQMLLCYGGVGNGKTHLLEALSYILKKCGHVANVISYPKLLRSLAFSEQCDKKRGNDGKPWMPLEKRLETYSTMPYLLIDDMGMGNVKTGWEADRDAGWFEQIIVSRYNSVILGEKLVTVITTNLDLDKIPGRIVSRFSDASIGRLVLNEGEDYRGKK